MFNCEEVVLCEVCHRQMTLVRICSPVMGVVGDHAGSWGEVPLFVCMEDDCPVYANSGSYIKKKYGYRVPCRVYRNFNGTSYGRGIIEVVENITCKEYLAEKALVVRYKKAEEQLFQIKQRVDLGIKLSEQDVNLLLRVFLLERKFPSVTRIKAANLLPVNDYSFIDLISNYHCKDPIVAQAAQRIVEKMLFHKFQNEN